MSVPHLLYDNRLSDGAVVATTTAANSAAANLSDWRPYTFWRSANAADQYLTVDCGAAMAADSVAIASHNLFSVGATLTIECSSDNFVADVTVAHSPALVSSNGALFWLFASQTKRYWRIKITTLTAACYIAVAVIGVRFSFPELIDGEFAPAAEQFMPAAGSSSGQLLGGVRGWVERSTAVEFVYLDDVWFRTVFMPIWNNYLSTGAPFFWAPNVTLGPDDVYLYRLDPGVPLDAAYKAPGKRSFELKMVGAAI